MNIKKLKKDVRGAALVYVIVAAAIIVLLGAATTATAYVNLRATQVQENSDNNFYSADTIMNAIVSGLENEMSIAYEHAYTLVITNINNYDDIETAKATFEDEFMTIFKNALADVSRRTSEAEYYNVDRIQGYVEQVASFKDSVRYAVTDMNGNGFLDRTEHGVILRNLHVTYEDDTGYYDEITTDIKISIPSFDPTYISDNPLELTINSFVVDDGLEINSQCGLQINGNAYINERESDNNAILLKDGSALTVVSPDELIAGGEIAAEENSSLLVKGTTEHKDGNVFWTENFDFGRYVNADLTGQVFVLDDLEINGSYADVSLAGEYYGYSQSDNDVNKSSAININGAHAKLDIEQLDMLVLAGSSYISTSSVDPNTTQYSNVEDIQTGEALSVKSNQIAYLVDEKEFSDAREQWYVPGFVSNPMSYTQYENMIELNGSWSAIEKRLIQNPLSYNNKSYQDYDMGISVLPVFSGKDNGTVYLYLNFSNADSAANFFVDAYKGDALLSRRLRTYAAQYIDSLKLNKDTALLVNENYIDRSVMIYTESLKEYTDDNLPISEDGLEYGQDEPDEEAMSEVLMQLYTQYLDDETVDGNGEKYKVLYSKLINGEKLTEFVTNATQYGAYADTNTNSDVEIIKNGVILSGTTGAKAIIVDNKNKDTYQLPTGRGIAIISGDVEITGNWTGTVLVGGRAYCTSGTKTTPTNITTDNAVVSSALPLYYKVKIGNAAHSTMVMNLFKGYENMKVNSATNSQGIDANLISNCITFTNWNKY